MSEVRLPKKGPLIWPPVLGKSKRKLYLEIIHCLARGLTEVEIAAARGVSYNTIKHQVCEMKKYFGAATNIETVLIARREWNLDL